MQLVQYIRGFFGGSRDRRRNRTQISEKTISRYESLEDRCLLAATQVITPEVTSIATSGDSTVSFDVQYSAREAEGTSAPAGLQVRMHYNSPELTPDVAAIRASAQTFSNFTLEVSDNPERSFNQTDLAGTDRYISLVWRTSDGTPAFPGDNIAVPLTLFTATFDTSSSFDGETIPFTSNLTLAVGNEVVSFESTPTELSLATNVAPVITSAATTTAAENQTTAYTAAAMDDDNDALTYAISGGADAALFDIVAATGVVTFKTAPDFEAPADAGADNVYNIQVTANDGTVNSAPQNVAITVTDVQETNRNPTMSAIAPVSFPENQTTAVLTVSASDPDPSDTLTYSLTGADAALFSISSSGVVTFNTAPDYEAPGDAGTNNVYNITANVNDGNGGTATQPAVITVTDVQETNRDPTMSAIAPVSFPENQTTAVLTVSASDPDLSNTLTYSLTGADAALFSISSSGVVTFNTAPDFEAPGDAGTNNVYNITANVNDGNGGTATQPAVITVTDVQETNRNPTMSAIAPVSFPENQTTAVLTVSASDPDLSNTLTYSLTGADAALFSISSFGVVTFNTAPDFEAPGDAGTNNVYNITANVNDGNGGTATQPAVITVTDVQDTNLNPTMSSIAPVSFPENQATAVLTVSASDPDLSDTLTYSLTGADAALFSISSSGVVRFNTAPDFEAPGDAGTNNVYNITANVNDGNGGTATQPAVITVTNVDETPNQTTGTIQGRKFNDLDGDGTRDANEAYLNGWTIQLVNSTGIVVASQVTANRGAEAGWYSFDAAPGTYTLQEVLQSGWQQTAPVDGTAVLAFSLDSARNLRTNQNDFLDWGGRNEKWLLGNQGWHFITPDGTLHQWDNSPRTNLTGTAVGTLSPAYYTNPSLLVDASAVQAPTYTVTAGQTLPDVNFGNFDASTPGSIHGRKWDDMNGDGQRTADEPWLNGWTIELVSGPGSVVQTTTTMDMDLNNNGTIEAETESGWYSFGDVAPGDWVVREQSRAGWTQTAPADATEVAAFDLDNELDLRFTRSLFPNWGGLNERWILGDDAWHYITPNGDVFRWNGSPKTDLNGTLVAQLSSEFHSDPAKLYDARNPYEVELTVSPGQRVEGIDFGNQQQSGSGGSGTSSFAGVGNVAAQVIGRNLFLTGDGADNGVRVFTNTDGFVTVDGLGNTTIQGQTQPWVIAGWTSVPGSIYGNFHDGSDAVVLQDVDVAGHVVINTHDGNDYLLIDNVFTGGNLDVRSNWGDNTIVVANSGFGNLMRVITGGGNDVSRTNNVSVGGRTVFRSWHGNDIYAASDSTFSGSFSIDAGAGDDRILDAGNSFSSTVTLNGGSGTDAVDNDSNSVFSRTPVVSRIEQTSIADKASLLDSIMERLAISGLDELLASGVS